MSRSLFKKANGFTLVELAVVITVILIIAGIAATRLRGVVEGARQRRTGQEFVDLLNAATHAVLRGMTGIKCATGPPPSCSSTNQIREYEGKVIPEGGERCFDLSSSDWGGAEAPKQSMKESLGPQALENSGRNAFGQPYAICIKPRRVSVRSCVPASAIPNEIGGASADPCPPAFRCNSGVCVEIGKSIFPPNMTRLAATYFNLYLGDATQW